MTKVKIQVLLNLNLLIDLSKTEGFETKSNNRGAVVQCDSIERLNLGGKKRNNGIDVVPPKD